MNYKDKYIKYKIKYLELKNMNINNQIGGKKQMKKKMKKKINNKENDSKMNIPKYSEHLSEPWFSLISLGLKTVEGRKNRGKFGEMKVGDIIEWKNNDFQERKILTKITGKEAYKTFAEYLETEGLNKCLPGIPSLEHGLSVYFKYFTKEEEAEFGVIAIRIELI
jgi:ASC-1-like (ASCH) protein